MNGDLNIMKKVAPDFAKIGSSGLVNRPVRIRIPNVLESQSSPEALFVRAE